MHLQLPNHLYQWLLKLSLITPIEIQQQNTQTITYNDQIYLQNGYLIAQLLKTIFKQHQHHSDALFKIRKIAFLSSNQNWAILQDILTYISYQHIIDIHNITHPDIIHVLEFLYDNFAPAQPQQSKPVSKKMHIDPLTFNPQLNITESRNLLEFILLLIGNTFNLNLNDSLGLLIADGKYLRKIIIEGTKDGHTSIINFYTSILTNIDTFNQLILTEPIHLPHIMLPLSHGIFSQQVEVCKLACLILQHLDEPTWFQTVGYNLILTSEYTQALSLLLKKIQNNHSIIFNSMLFSRFNDQKTQFLAYIRLISYLPKTLHCKEIVDLLPVDYYLGRAVELFDTDHHSVPRSIKGLAKQLITTIALNFWSKIGNLYHNQILFAFDPQFCSSHHEQITTIAQLFSIIRFQLQKQLETVERYFKIVMKYYHSSPIDTRSFVLANLSQLYLSLPNHFPLGFVLNSYTITQISQSTDFQLLSNFSNDQNLMEDQIIAILRISSIYYHQQLHCSHFISIISQLIKHKSSKNWGEPLVAEILNKWPSFELPKISKPLPKQTKKLQPIGLKKVEMLKLHNYRKYQQILSLTTQIADKQFLQFYHRNLLKTIKILDKNKSLEMQLSQKWLINLLPIIENKLQQLKQQPENSQKTLSQSQFTQQHELESVDLQPSLLQKEQQKFIESEADNDLNEFLQQQQCKLLPFTQKAEQYQPNFIPAQLFQNYELIHINNIKDKYKTLFTLIYTVYQMTPDLNSFLESLGILRFLQDQLPMAQSILSQIKTKFSQNEVTTQLIIQLALLVFQFKKNRRISIKCVESFLTVIQNKLKAKYDLQDQQFTGAIVKKVTFDHEISLKMIKQNPSISSHSLCLDIVNYLFQRAIGIPLVEPISKIINQINPVKAQQQSGQQIKNELKNKQYQQTQKELQTLQKLIQSEPQLPISNTTQNSPIKKQNTTTRIKTQPKISNKVSLPKQPTIQISQPSQQDQIKKVADLKQKINKRRKQLQSMKQKSINDQKNQ